MEFDVYRTADRYISDEIVELGAWEPFETELVRRMLRAGELFLDGGANIGWYTVIAALLGARVIACEPMSKNRELLRSNISLNGVDQQVTVVPAALGGEPGSAKLKLSPDNQGDHRLSTMPGEQFEAVPLTTVDAVCGADVPRIVKLDTQGSESGILRGATATLSPDRAIHTTFIVEFWPFGLADCGSSAEELIGLLASYVPDTHACFQIADAGDLRPVTLSKLASWARLGDYSPAAAGHTNLLLVPLGELDAVGDLIVPDVSHERVGIRAFERSVHSQNGEDGIIEELARRIGCSTTMVEFGAGDGEECNSRFPREHGWRVAAFDGNPENSEWVERAFVTAENAPALLESTGLADGLGVLSVDLDGNDYWVLRRLFDVTRPAIVVVEYNATLGPVEPWAVQYRPQRRWDHTNYFGASLAAYAILAQRAGYELVGCESRGVNAFFVRADFVAASGIEPLTVEQAYVVPRYGEPGPLGHQTGHLPTTRRFVYVGVEAEADRAYAPWVGSRLARPFRLLRERVETSDAWRQRRVRLGSVPARLRGIPRK